MNKLVKCNLVRGLLTKVFENDHTYVACKKGKQHRASCKTKPVSSVNQPLQRLHMDLFRPTFIKILNKKIYCLVVTDDYSRFTWVFFLATKDETSLILLWDEGDQEGFSVPRTPHQNSIAERKNRTLIEAARTMLADLLLSIPFWVEAVNTACYVQNKNTDGDAAFDKKEPKFEGRKPESEVNVSPSSIAQSKKHDEKTKREAKGKSPDNAADSLVLAVGRIFTNTFSASPTHGKSSYVDPLNIAVKLKDITYFDNEDDVGAEADFNNLETTIIVSPNPTIRVHKDHLVTQIIGDLSSATQTRSMTRVAKDQGGLSQIIMMTSIHEKGIDYEEFFAPVARIEAISLFLAYASFMGFMMYQMDVKSAFLYETIKEEVYICQPPGYEDPDHPDKVYKVVKALYRLHQAPRA
nr:putative ribonuclease H-like domain-containing protein [Tanacetum cinerariifolium]